MTISLIDANGRCRDEAQYFHEQCMSLIRETLDHARSMIGHCSAASGAVTVPA